MAANNVNICKSTMEASEETFIWEIDNFSRRRMHGSFDSGRFTSTSPFGIDNTLQWLLRIYPRDEQYEDYVTIDVFALNISTTFSAEIECSIRDAKGEDKLQTVAENRLFFKNDCREELSKFIERAKLWEPATGLLPPDDRLTIVCKITVFEEKMTMEFGKININNTKVPECHGMEDIGGLLDNGGQFSDCTLVAADGKEFKVYKGILACRSRVFAAMFEHEEMSESKEGVVKIKDIKSEVLEQMLRFIYEGTAPKLEEMAKELMEAADKYQLDRLKAMCERELVNSMGNENACELLAFAHLHSAEQLKAHAIKFIQHNAKEVVKSDGWKMLKANYRELSNQLWEGRD